MPELPEVETIRSRLAPALAGRRIERVTILDARLTRPEPPEAIAAALEGERTRRCSPPWQVFGIRVRERPPPPRPSTYDGRLSASSADSSDADPHRRALITLDDGSDVAYRDVRRFGNLAPAGAGVSSTTISAPGSAASRSSERSRLQSSERRSRAGARPSKPRSSTRELSREWGTSTRTKPCGSHDSTRFGRRAASLETRSPNSAAVSGRPFAAGSSVRGRHSATTEIRTEGPGECNTSSTSTAGPVSRATAAERRSRKSARRGVARGSVPAASHSTVEWPPTLRPRAARERLTLEPPELRVPADRSAVDDDLRHRPASGPLLEADAEVRLTVELDLLVREPLLVEERLRAEAEPAPRSRVHLDPGHG